MDTNGKFFKFTNHESSNHSKSVNYRQGLIFCRLKANRILSDSHLGERLFILFFDSISFGYLESYEFKLLGGYAITFDYL